MPMVLLASVLAASRPISTPTPAMPMRTPQTLAGLSGSPAKRRATISVNSGVVAFSTPASALAMRVWP